MAAQTFALQGLQLWRGPYVAPVDEEIGGAEMPLFKETASQSYKVNDLVYLDSNGTVAICTTTSHKLNSAVLGLAQTAATGVTGAQVKVRPITRNDRFLVSVFHTTAASAVTAQTQLGGIYGLYYDTAALPTGTTGLWCLDLVNTSPETGGALAYVQVVQIPTTGIFKPLSGTGGSFANPAIGDVYAPVVVKFLPLSIQSDGSTHRYNLQWD